jgi:hypothetical protein
MGLIEIARFANCVENREALTQEVRCMPGTLDLTGGTVGQACRLQKPPLCGSLRQLWFAM